MLLLGNYLKLVVGPRVDKTSVSHFHIRTMKNLLTVLFSLEGVPAFRILQLDEKTGNFLKFVSHLVRDTLINTCYSLWQHRPTENKDSASNR
jgi:hypothetical protein